MAARTALFYVRLTLSSRVKITLFRHMNTKQIKFFTILKYKLDLLHSD